MVNNKLATFINFIGLSFGISICVLLVVFVKNELSFDDFHVHKDRIYRAWIKEQVGAKRSFSTVTPFPVGAALINDFPEIEAASLFVPVQWKSEENGKTQDETVHMVSPDFFKIFTFNLHDGQLQNIFQDPADIVLSRQAARKHFGTQSPVGKSIQFKVDDTYRSFIVKAVLEDVPSNSSLRFSYLISDVSKSQVFGNMTESWYAVLGETYILLRADANADVLQSKFPSLLQKVLGSSASAFELGIQPLLDIHANIEYPVGLAGVSDPAYAYILAGIAFMVLMIACINFIALSIGKSLTRAKEVGLRKVVGAMRVQLIHQHLSETVIIVCIALLGGLLLTRLYIPYFNSLVESNLKFEVTSFLIVTSLSLIVIIGLLAGSYPAFIISSFSPVTILKGNFQGVNTKKSLRSALLVVQFIFSLGLIAATLIMSEQLKFLQQKNLGFNKDQVLVVPLNVNAGRFGATIKKGMETSRLFIQELSKSPAITQVAASAQEIGSGWMRIGFTATDGEYREFNLNVVSDGYISTMGMKIAQGRDFQKESLSDIKRAIIVNESFARAYNMPNPVGMRLPGPGFEDHEIIGVVEDFNYQSLHGAVKPVVLVLDFAVISSGFQDINLPSSPSPKLIIRFQGNKTDEVVKTVAAAWKDFMGNDDFSYQFLDDKLSAQYRSETNLGKMVAGATAMAVILGALGLFSFSSLSIRNKLKEISIRKILGATENGLFMRIANQYLRLTIVSLVLATPITWYCMNKWLETFAFKITINPLYFILTGLFFSLITLITVSYHAWNASRTEPARNLRVE